MSDRRRKQPHNQTWDKEDNLKLISFMLLKKFSFHKKKILNEETILPRFSKQQIISKKSSLKEVVEIDDIYNYLKEEIELEKSKKKNEEDVFNKILKILRQSIKNDYGIGICLKYLKQFDEVFSCNLNELHEELIEPATNILDKAGNKGSVVLKLKISQDLYKKLDGKILGGSFFSELIEKSQNQKKSKNNPSN